MCPVPALTTGLEVDGCTAEGNATEGDNCTYSCMSGYTLDGASMVTCGSDRMFSPPIPTCIGKIFEFNRNSDLSLSSCGIVS